ncbi:uncharacterized protein SPSK_07675 [Sporothrix schenckii 1099-18]|uniref:Uncharacterized protein n=1 Tax=Sporothrix schenckii 1099-18 TaxID=1397361 RepID=A0A0F2MJD6_SPOSC|nr:uncharacterized protein SPSK_07675 [Sporothrix schenckii 1099-18]KJR88296.1 hypothetical protein SPSK_07675 [Sporothrix schenckii 1099-18]
MSSSEKPEKSSSPPAKDRYYPSPYGPEQPGNYPPIPPPSSGLPASEPGGRNDDTRINGINTVDGSSRPPSYRPYDSMPSLLPQKQQDQRPFPPYIPSAPPSMVEIPPQPTMSTAGSTVGAPVVGGVGGAPGISGPPGGGYGGGPPSSAAPALTQSPGPIYANDTAAKSDIRSARASVESGLIRLMELQGQQRQHLQYGPGAANVPNSTAAAVQDQLRLQTGSVLRDLRQVRRALYGKAKAAENHRFRRWLVGGLLATFIPLVRRLFRRRGGNDSSSSTTSAPILTANDTEYAFVRSRSLVDRMLSSVSRRGGLASIAFFVFAVLYIFSNEVSLRVARTVGRRLKRLSSKIERGDEPLNEADLKQLSGWRWRVLLWGRQ